MYKGSKKLGQMKEEYFPPKNEPKWLQKEDEKIWWYFSMKISGNTEIKWFGINSETVEIRLISSKNEPKWLQKDNKKSIVSFYIIIWYIILKSKCLGINLAVERRIIPSKSVPKCL